MTGGVTGGGGGADRLPGGRLRKRAATHGLRDRLGMTRKRRRLYIVLAGMTTLGIATALMLSAFRRDLVFFYGPTALIADHIPAGRRVRIGGLVAMHSMVRDGDRITFVVTDKRTSIKVKYDGILPDLFRQGGGVVVEGALNRKGVFVADQVLAKHDARYMPPEVVAALKKAGEWRPQQVPR